MKFTSTRNKENSVNFFTAIFNCMPNDGGLYVPSETEDLRRWILYTDENTSFSSIAGTLTSAFINDEFSPIICETIATRAFPFVPEIKALSENLFLMDLSTGPTGNHRDFGISFLSSAVETILQLNGGGATFLDFSSSGELGASLAWALRGKKHIKAVILYPKGKVRGIEKSDLVVNGGNIYPIELDFDCSEEELLKISQDLIKQVFEDSAFIKKNNVMVSNTTNIGRLLPQAFFYPFAFSRIKNKVHSDIFYALASGNYSNVVAGLYAWQFALPLNGFIIPAKDALSVGTEGEPILVNSKIPLAEREKCSPCEPSNLERLEDIFAANSLMMKHFIFPVEVTESQILEAGKELYKEYGIFADRHTSRAYAAAKIEQSKREENFATVLIARDHPSLCADFVKNMLGESPKMPERIKKSLEPLDLCVPVVKSAEDIKKIINSL